MDIRFLKIFVYVAMPFAISSMQTNSSAVCERDDSPGPILSAGNGISVRSDVVGDTNVVHPAAAAARTNG